MATSDAHISEATEHDAFFAWLPDDLEFRVAVRHDHGKWYALAEDFDITGMGHSIKDAIVDMDGLVRAYLESYRREGRPFEDALRPIPFRLRLAILAGSGAQRVLGRVAGRAGSSSPLPRERRYLFGPRGLNGIRC